MVPPRLQAESNEPLCFLVFSFLFRPEPQPVVSLTIIYLLWVIPAQRPPSSTVILNPTKLTVMINNHTNISPLNVKTMSS